MKPALFLGTALLSLLLAACATKPPEPVKFTLSGFSIAVGPKDGWNLMQQTPERVVLAKPGDFTGETLTVLMTTSRFSGQGSDALQRHVRDIQTQGLDAKRYRVTLHDISPQTAAGLACVQSRLEIEDRGAAAATGPVTGIITESLTVTCPDPGHPNQAVGVSYVHQSYPEDKGRLFMDKALPILDTLEHAGSH